MGHKYSRDELLDGAVQCAIDEGLNRLTFGRLASRLGVSDRIVVYYFPTKQDLVVEVLGRLGSQMQAVLAAAFTATATDRETLAGAAYPLLASGSADPIFRLYFELCGLAAAGLEPFDQLASRLMSDWIGWLAEFFEGDANERRAEAEATVALIDGLLLLRHIVGASAADRAAAQLGIRRR